LIADESKMFSIDNIHLAVVEEQPRQNMPFTTKASQPVAHRPYDPEKRMTQDSSLISYEKGVHNMVYSVATPDKRSKPGFSFRHEKSTDRADAWLQA